MTNDGITPPQGEVLDDTEITMDTTTRTELELVFRGWRGAPDAQEMARVSNAANLAEGVDEHNTAEELLNWFSHPSENADSSRDVVMVEVDGQLVGYGWHGWVDATDGVREHRLGGYVHPAWTRRGIGRQLLGWLEQRARASLLEHPTQLPVVYGSWADEHRVGKQVLLKQAGYAEVRFFYDMRRDRLDKVDVPPMPDGLEVRPIPTDRASLYKVWQADHEAFRDHWGGWVFNDAVFEEILEDPNFDPSLYVIGWDGDEIAGAVINVIPRSENEAMHRHRGWLESVFVRRSWRRRGLAAALVARSLVLLRERGMDHAMLGVDAENPTGALGVYERAGFVVVKRSIAYRKPMAVTDA